MKKVITTATIIIGTAGVCFAGDEDSKRPNFLFIIADDPSPYDLKAYEPGQTDKARLPGYSGVKQLRC